MELVINIDGLPPGFASCGRYGSASKPSAEAAAGNDVSRV